MKDPLRKPRKLRFRVGRALLISAPLMGSLACGEPQISVNPGPVEQPPPEERVNVPAMDEPPAMEEPRPPEATNVVEVVEDQEKAEGASDMDEAPPPPRPRMVNPGPRPPPDDLERL